jgi:spore germination protein KC
MKKKLINSILITMLLLSGCSNYKELNGLSIVVAMGLDYIPEEKQFEMIVQIINPSAIATQTGAQGIPVIALSEKGRTISEAARRVTKRVSRPNIYSHVALFIIGEKLASEESFNFVFDVFERDSKIRVNIPVIIARGDSAFKVMNNLPALDKLPAKSITGKIQNTSALLGENHETQLREVIAALSSKGREPVVNGTSLTQYSESSETLQNFEKVNSTYNTIHGLGVFKDGKLVGWLDGPPARSVQFVDNLIKETNIQIQCNKERYDSLELTRVKTKTEVKMKKDIPMIHIKLKSIGHIDEVLCNDDFNKAKTLTKYEKLAEKNVKQMIMDGVADAQKMGSDVFGFGDKLHISDPKAFKKYEKNWNDTFKKAKVKVSVDVQIDNIGMRKEAYPF